MIAIRMSKSGVIFDQLDEIIEQIPAVMRSRRRFRMVLNGKGRPVLQPDSFDRLVVQVDMRDLHIGSIPYRLRINPEPMILRGDLTTPRNQVLYRMIKPSMPVMHLEGRNIIR